MFKQLEQFEQLRQLCLTTDDDGLAIILQCLPKLSSLGIHGDLMTSAGLRHIQGHKELKALHMGGKRIDDDGLAMLHSASLEELRLSGTSVTGKGLRHLKNLPSLARLNFNVCLIDDTSVDDLKGMQNLTELVLGGTNLTAKGIEALRAALPKCKIQWP